MYSSLSASPGPCQSTVSNVERHVLPLKNEVRTKQRTVRGLRREKKYFFFAQRKEVLLFARPLPPHPLPRRILPPWGGPDDAWSRGFWLAHQGTKKLGLTFIFNLPPSPGALQLSRRAHILLHVAIDRLDTPGAARGQNQRPVGERPARNPAYSGLSLSPMCAPPPILHPKLPTLMSDEVQGSYLSTFPRVALLVHGMLTPRPPACLARSCSLQFMMTPPINSKLQLSRRETPRSAILQSARRPGTVSEFFTCRMASVAASRS